MQADLIDLLEHAAAIIDGEALAMLTGHTRPDDRSDWGEDLAARAAYEDMKRTCCRMYAAADAERRLRMGLSRAAEHAHQARPADMIVCHAVSRDLLPGVEAVAMHLLAAHPKSSGEQRIEMIFAAGVHALMQAHGLRVAA